MRPIGIVSEASMNDDTVEVPIEDRLRIVINSPLYAGKLNRPVNVRLLRDCLAEIEQRNKAIEVKDMMLGVKDREIEELRVEDDG